MVDQVGRAAQKGSSPRLAIGWWLTLHQLEVDTDPGFLENNGQEMVCLLTLQVSPLAG